MTKKRPDSPKFTELLDKLLQVTKEQIDTFRSTLAPENQLIFDTKLNEKERKILTTMYNMPDEELAALIRMQVESGSLAKFHKIGEHFISLDRLTGDERYRRILGQEDFEE